MSDESGISFVQLVEYTRSSLEEKINDLDRDFNANRAEFGATLQDMRRDSRQLVERQYKYERMIEAKINQHREAIDDRIGNIERSTQNIERFARWLIFTVAGGIFIAVSTAVVFKVLGL